ncbi:hypothetical protein D3C84_959260 [compost metagenome]
MPGVIALALAVGVEHDAGDHEFNPGRTVDQPCIQGLLLLDIEDASIAGCKIASGPAVGNEPLDIAVGEQVPVFIQLPVDLPIDAEFVCRAMAGLVHLIGIYCIGI